MFQDKDIGAVNSIAYDEENNPHPIPKSMLPVKLPQNIDLDVKGNPLDYQKIGKRL